MTRPSKGRINIDIKDPVPDWEPYRQPKAPGGAPSVLYVVRDDVGFSVMEPFGGPIETPNINRIAQRGLTYTNFHTILLDSIMGSQEGPRYQLGCDYTPPDQPSRRSSSWRWSRE